jgi:ERCC4-related helicase
MSNYSLTIHFNNLDELLIFTNAYNKRSIKSEIKTIKLNDKRQILILSDRKQHLDDMFQICQEIDNKISIGYYVGGMKKEKLKESEKCKILLGTFPMANEGLDIPSLNGLVLSTPKSDIIQSVGRIDRMKHVGIQPIIIDIVDDFSVFTNQSKKRLKVYNSKKYEVIDYHYDLDNNKITKKKIFNKNCFDGSDGSDGSDDNNNNNHNNIKTALPLFSTK